MASLARKLVSAAAVTVSLAPLVGACADLEVRSVYTALDTSGMRKRNVFYTDSESIYCDADYASTRKDITFNAVVRQIFDPKGGPVPATQPAQNADIVAAIGEINPGVSRGILSMEWTRPMDPTGMFGTLPFPAGWYTCEYYVDGIDPKTGVRAPPPNAPILQGKSAFRVDYINCPVAGAAPNTICGGYVQPGATGTCKGVDASKTYKCDDASGLWVPL